MSAHTPGPWQTEDRTGSPWNVTAADGRVDVALAQQIGADGRRPGAPIRTANAALIAAAPDYRAATEAVFLAIEKLPKSLIEELARDVAWMAAFRALRTAHSKAGRP